MRNVNGKFIGIALGAAIFGLVVGPRAFASRCGEQNPPRCGLDSDPNPPDPAGSILFFATRFAILTAKSANVHRFWQ